MAKVFRQTFKRIIGISNDKLLAPVTDTSFIKSIDDGFLSLDR